MKTFSLRWTASDAPISWQPQSTKPNSARTCEKATLVSRSSSNRSHTAPPWKPSRERWKTPVVKKCCANESPMPVSASPLSWLCDGLEAELVAGLGEWQLGADVEAFLEAEVAAVALLVERALEAVDAAEDHHFLELRNANAHRVARFIVVRTHGAQIERIGFAVRRSSRRHRHTLGRSPSPQLPSQHGPPSGEPIHSPSDCISGPIIDRRPMPHHLAARHRHFFRLDSAPGCPGGAYNSSGSPALIGDLLQRTNPTVVEQAAALGRSRPGAMGDVALAECVVPRRVFGCGMRGSPRCGTIADAAALAEVACSRLRLADEPTTVLPARVGFGAATSCLASVGGTNAFGAADRSLLRRVRSGSDWRAGLRAAGDACVGRQPVLRRTAC